MHGGRSVDGAGQIGEGSRILSSQPTCRRFVEQRQPVRITVRRDVPVDFHSQGDRVRTNLRVIGVRCLPARTGQRDHRCDDNVRDPAGDKLGVGDCGVFEHVVKPASCDHLRSMTCRLETGDDISDMGVDIVVPGLVGLACVSGTGNLFSG